MNGQLLTFISETQMNEALFSGWNCYTIDFRKVPDIIELEPFLERCQFLTETTSDKPEKASLPKPQNSRSTANSKRGLRPVLVIQLSIAFPICSQDDHSVTYCDMF